MFYEDPNFENNEFDNNDFNNDTSDNNGGKKKNHKGVIVLIIVAVACVIFIGLGSLAAIIINNEAGRDLLSKQNATQQETVNTVGSTDDSDSAISSTEPGSVTVTDVSGIVDKCMPSIVAITSTTLVEQSNSNDIFDYYFGEGGSGNNNGNQKQTYEQQAAGSGIIVGENKSELLIVTNSHVIDDADKLQVQFYGQTGKKGVTASLKGNESSKEIAILSVKKSAIPTDIMKKIKKASLGDSETVKVGQGVVAIGNALGYGQSVTSGIVSAKDRTAEVENKKLTLIQTDAAINGGNSGGALLDQNGKVIGINVMKYSSSGTSSMASVEGMGFAIPISKVKSVISNLEKQKTRTKVSENKQGWLGISGQDVTSEVSQIYSMPQGVLVYQTSKGGPADDAGIKAKDIITKVDGQTVDSMESLQNILEYYKAGETVKVTVERPSTGSSYKEETMSVKLGDKSALSGLQTND